MNEVPVHLLRDTLQARGPEGPSPACLDPETAAAWADDSLGPAARQAAEAHTADCGRCQALIAAMIRTAPPAAARPWWRSPAIGWLVPLAAAAALVWMIVPRPPRVPSSTVSLAIGPEPFQPVQGGVSSTPPETVPQPAAVPNAIRKSGRGDTKTVRSGVQASAADASPILPDEQAGATTAGGAFVAPAAPVPPPVADNPVPAPSASTVPSPQADTVSGGLASPAPSVAVRRTAGAQGGSATAAFLSNPLRTPALILSPNGASQWRILSGGAVQHSTDRGSTWDVQATGATLALTAGASPAPSICWLVGREGIVLLSIDGRSWRRIAFPETADLIAVSATDDRNATVNTLDGRTFRTENGGQTWTR